MLSLFFFMLVESTQMWSFK